jgi:cell division protein FtsI/penicillin-binding protein 2
LTEEGEVVTEQLKNMRRMLAILFVISIILGIIGGRLLWIQMIDSTAFSSLEVDLVTRSVEQRKWQIALDSGRGAIVDRTGRILTGETFFALVIFPLKQYSFEREPKIDQLAAIIGVNKKTILFQISEMKAPSIIHIGKTGRPVRISEEQANQVNQLKIKGILALPYNVRYSDNAIARHVIGYVGKDPAYIEQAFAPELKKGTMTIDSIVGMAGLEKSFQPFLQGLGPSVISYFVDTHGNPLQGLQMRRSKPENPYYPLSITTTLDYNIQKIAENVMDEAGINEGAVVVLDANNADVLAMASRPNYDPAEVKPEQGNWGNRAVKQTIPGSVFKTVIAAAAIEKGIFRPNDYFYDDTGLLGKYQMRSWKAGGHGKITFADAYAESCNVCFAQVAMKLTGDDIEAYSRKFGLLDRVGWRSERLFGISPFYQIDGEQKGQLFVNDHVRNDEGVRVQTSIGQRDVRITPLQAANMVVTLLHGGKVYSPRLVKRIDYFDGTLLEAFPVQTLHVANRLHAQTANQLKQWMRQVVTHGTGRSLNHHPWKLAGKTGTAQVKAGGRELHHQWFVGFGPYESPRYAVAVVALNESPTAKKKAVDAFGKMMNELARLD